jgi:hypothetical protein
MELVCWFCWFCLPQKVIGGQGSAYSPPVSSVPLLLYSTEIGVFSTFASLVYLATRAYMEGGKFLLFMRFFLIYTLGAAACLVPFAVYFGSENALWQYFRTVFIEIPLNHFTKFTQPLPTMQYPDKFSLIQLFRCCGEAKIWLPAATYLAAVIYLGWACLAKPTWDQVKLRILALVAYGVPLYITAFRSVTGGQFTSSLAPSILIGMMFLL